MKALTRLSNQLYFILTLGVVSMYIQPSPGQTLATIDKVGIKTKPSAIKEETWKVDAVHSKVKFNVTHLVISEVEGTFKVYDGTIKSKNKDFTDAAIQFTVDATSIHTGNEMRDKHLKSKDFFDTETFPKLQFKSISFRRIKGHKYKLTGNLKIKDITKKVTFEVIYGGLAKDGYGNTKAGFKAKTTVNRYDYGLQWNTVTEAGGLTVSKEVAIVLNLQFKLSK